MFNSGLPCEDAVTLKHDPGPRMRNFKLSVGPKLCLKTDIDHRSENELRMSRITFALS